MTAKVRPLHMKEGTEPAINVLVTEEEIDGIIDAIDDAIDKVSIIPDCFEDLEFYRGLKKRWLRHAKDIRRSLRERDEIQGA